MTANAATLRAGRSVEGLHQLRVALRRLEVVLKAFGEEFRQEWLSDLRGRAKILSSRLGPARDLDVFITELLDVPAEEGDREAFAACATRDGRDARPGLETGGRLRHRHRFRLLAEDVAALSHSRLPMAPDTKAGPRRVGACSDRQQRTRVQARPQGAGAARKAICIACASR